MWVPIGMNVDRPESSHGFFTIRNPFDATPVFSHNRVSAAHRFSFSAERLIYGANIP